MKDSTKLRSRFKAEPVRDEESQLAEVRRLALAAGAPAATLKSFLAAPQYTKIVEEGGEHVELGGELIDLLGRLQFARSRRHQRNLGVAAV
ncbi:hypothetical protein [Streptomyces sp. MJM1172]|uniref:hypothetical protein n=1 Tax=Streptomyces sp. MJM1172 TaxID=1703926 RepID=UPI000A86935E|nr:hypothetical protein [Streptomyces sp. MJM1172]